MKYSEFHDDGAYMAVYFVLDQSRSDPPYTRAEIMLSAGRFFADADSEPKDEVHCLANELFDCEQDVQRLIAGVRQLNAAQLVQNPAAGFLLTRLEKSDLATKLEFIGNAQNLGLRTNSGLKQSWLMAQQRVAAFEQRFEVFMFRLRTHHWRESNAAAERSLEQADAQVKGTMRPAA